jgi:hypothetical protein
MEVEVLPSPSVQRVTKPRTEASLDTTESELGSFRPVTLEMIQSLIDEDPTSASTTTGPSRPSGTNANSSFVPTPHPPDVASRMIGTELNLVSGLTLLIFFAGRLNRIEPVPIQNDSGSTTGEI